MKSKIILGILASDSYNDKETFLDQISKHGFHVHSISSKIEEMAKYLLKKEDSSEISEKEIAYIRQKGYLVNKLYWVNVLLTSIPEEEDSIMVSDLWEEDLYEGYVTPVVSDPILVPNMDFIKYPLSLLNDTKIKVWVEEIKEKMYNTKK